MDRLSAVQVAQSNLREHCSGLEYLSALLEGARGNTANSHLVIIKPPRESAPVIRGRTESPVGKICFVCAGSSAIEENRPPQLAQNIGRQGSCSKYRTPQQIHSGGNDANRPHRQRR